VSAPPASVRVGSGEHETALPLSAERSDYRLGRRRLSVWTADREFARAFGERFRYHAEASAGAEAIDLRLEFVALSDHAQARLRWPALAAAALEELPDGEWTCWSEGDWACLYRAHDLLALCDPPRGLVRILAWPAPPRPVERDRSRLRRKGLACDREELTDVATTLLVRLCDGLLVHGASVARGDDGLLLCGVSGSGKTTAAIALRRGGFSLLADELSVLHLGDGAPRIAGLLVPPLLAGASDDPDRLETALDLAADAEKRPVALETGAAPRHEPCALGALVFLRRPATRVAEHAVAPLTSLEAFERLMPQILDPALRYRLAEVVAALAAALERVPAFELTLGRDLAALPDAVARCLRHD
jgi:hypothetical protein